MRALVTGITGQDGAYLADLLLTKGYTVFGAYRRSAQVDKGKLRQIGVDPEAINWVPFELGEYENIKRTIDSVKPDEIYNLAAMSFVKDSFEMPLYTTDINGMGVLRILEVIRGTDIKLYQASTSEMFGKGKAPQNESTPFVPRSPYGCSKLLAHSLCVNYREAYDVKVSCGILFNHESPIRGREFVTQKIAHDVWTGKLDLGNLEAKRDWGHARDYVYAMWLMLQYAPDDFVISTGVYHTVLNFVDAAVESAGMTECDITINPKYFRPTEVDWLCGDPEKAHRLLGWEATTTFQELVDEMVWEARP